MSNEPMPAKLAYLTWPDLHTAVINVQCEGDDYPRQFTLTRDQLFTLNSQSADLLCRTRGAGR